MISRRKRKPRAQAEEEDETLAIDRVAGFIYQMSKRDTTKTTTTTKDGKGEEKKKKFTVKRRNLNIKGADDMDDNSWLVVGSHGREKRGSSCN